MSGSAKTLVALLVLAVLLFLLEADPQTKDLCKQELLSALHRLYEQRESYQTSAIQLSHWLQTAFLRGLFTTSRCVSTVFALARHPSMANMTEAATILAELCHHAFGTGQHAFKVIINKSSVVRTTLTESCGEGMANTILVGLLLCILVFLNAVYHTALAIAERVWRVFTIVLYLVLRPWIGLVRWLFGLLSL